MLIPLVSNAQALERRKGGHGGGRGSGGGSSSGKGTSSSGKASWTSWKGSTGYSNIPSASSVGGGPERNITEGTYENRTVGGGLRSQVYGTGIYGSGYPGVEGRGVAGRGFPFYFWPLSFGTDGPIAYLYNDEYGPPDNSERPGGPQTTFTFTHSKEKIFLRFISDNDTVNDLLENINGTCNGTLAYSGPYTTEVIKPEQILQYYRASSAALGLDGYNNTAVLSGDIHAKSIPVPSSEALACLNHTIGYSIPLVDVSSGTPCLDMRFIGLVWIFVWSMQNLIT